MTCLFNFRCPSLLLTLSASLLNSSDGNDAKHNRFPMVDCCTGIQLSQSLYKKNPATGRVNKKIWEMIYLSWNAPSTDEACPQLSLPRWCWSPCSQKTNLPSVCSGHKKNKSKLVYLNHFARMIDICCQIQSHAISRHRHRNAIEYRLCLSNSDLLRFAHCTYARQSSHPTLL